MSSGDSDPSRRVLMTGATLAALTAAATNRAYAAQTAAAPAMGEPSLVNSVTEYPRPPFPKQQQPWPGLTSRMTPRPDHGEESYKGTGRLTGRKALITGGDSGMGRAAAIAFAREGADVAINYLPAEEADAQETRRRKGVALPGDIRDETFCNNLVSNAINQLGGLDIVVSNAARQISQNSLLDITTEQFDTTLKTNVYAMFWIIKAAVPHLQAGSTIIATTSVNAYDPGENIIDYAATKGAIMVFVKGLAKQLASKGIRVNGVAPGPVWTPLQVTGGQPIPILMRIRLWTST